MEKAKKTIVATFFALALAIVLMASVEAAITSITLISPADGAWTNNSTPTFTFTAVSDSDATFSCVLYVNDTNKGSNNSVANNIATNITASTIADGKNYVWKISCTDSEGTFNSSTRTLNVDTTPPTVLLSLSKDKIEYLKSIIADCSASSDNLGTLTYSIVLTKPTGATVFSTSSVVEFSGTSTNVKGLNTITCTVTDQAGNSASTSKTFLIASSEEGGVTITPPPTTTTTQTNKTALVLVLFILFIGGAAIALALASKRKKRRR
jgi:hypothetical protein